jgi:hypothetical protein
VKPEEIEAAEHDGQRDQEDGRAIVEVIGFARRPYQGQQLMG